ncbi:hypothetical protein I541_5292 [Mycobacteroides abscessus]|nr:hypothetical protein L836_0013 [Mycobacteroides abscessus MAB_110811_2726]EUA73083.1 hypothetical protein I541_5292 [Mycobacteroides abscessus]
MIDPANGSHAKGSDSCVAQSNQSDPQTMSVDDLRRAAAAANQVNHPDF